MSWYIEQVRWSKLLEQVAWSEPIEQAMWNKLYIEQVSGESLFSAYHASSTSTKFFSLWRQYGVTPVTEQVNCDICPSGNVALVVKPSVWRKLFLAGSVKLLNLVFVAESAY